LFQCLRYKPKAFSQRRPDGSGGWIGNLNGVRRVLFRLHSGDMNATKESIRQVVETTEPIQDQIYGPRYRCSLTLKDGTFLPCAILQSKERLVALAKRRIKEELAGKGALGGPDPYGQI